MMDDRPIFRDVLVPRLMVVMDTKDCNHGNVETEICLSTPEETGPVILPLRYRKHVRNSRGHKYHPPDTRKNSGVPLLNDVTDSGGCCRDSPLNDVTVSGNLCRKCRHRYGVPPGNGCNGVYHDKDVIDESPEGSRKKDLTVALAWLRQEIVSGISLGLGLYKLFRIRFILANVKLHIIITHHIMYMVGYV